MARRPKIGKPVREPTITAFPAMVSFHATMRTEPDDLALHLSRVFTAMASAYGDVRGNVMYDGALPRQGVESLVDRLRTGPGAHGFRSFSLAPNELASGPILAYLGPNPGSNLSYHRLSAFEGHTQYAWEFSWFARNENRATADLSCVLSLLHARRGAITAVGDAMDALHAAAASGRAIMARADLYVVPRPWGRYYHSISPRYAFPVGDALAAMARTSWSHAERTPGALPPAAWSNLLSPDHLERLGGREAFVGELRGMREKGKLPRMCSQELTGGYLRVCTADVFREGMWPLNDESVVSETLTSELAWLNWRWAQVGLLVWQQPGLGASLIGDGMSGRPPQAAPSTDARLDHEAAERELAAYMERLRSNPPRCVAACALPATTQEKKAIAKSYGALSTAFAIGVDGARTPLTVWGRRGDGFIRMRDPIYIGGPNRSSAVFVFDSRIDGWDARWNPDKKPAPKAGEPLHCARCGHNKFHAIAIFQYSGDNEELDEPERIANVQDYFSWFALRVRCGSCGRAEVVADVECA